MAEYHKPLPVLGYNVQSAKSIDTVNDFKLLEDDLLQVLDILQNDDDIDKRWLAIGRTQLEQAFMAINRSVFKPTRIKET